MNFGKKLRKIREEKGLTRQQLAEKTGLSLSTLYMYETKNMSPTIDIVLNIAKALNVSLNDLVENDEIEKDSNDSNISLKKIPVYETILFNPETGSLDFKNDVDFIVMPNGMKGDFGLIVYNDSMEPRLKVGDIAIIQRQSILDSGHIGVFILKEHNKPVIRLYYKNNNVVSLMSTNPEYTPLFFSKKEWKDVIVIGKVVGKYEKWE